MEIEYRPKYVRPSAIPSSLFCPICTDVIYQANKLPCGHILCKSCMDSWLKTNAVCPFDRKPVKRAKIRDEKLGNAILNDMEVYCQYKKHGCTFTNKLKYIFIHSNVCEKKDLPECMQPFVSNQPDHPDDMVNERLEKMGVNKTLMMRIYERDSNIITGVRNSEQIEEPDRIVENEKQAVSLSSMSVEYSTTVLHRYSPRKQDISLSSMSVEDSTTVLHRYSPRETIQSDKNDDKIIKDSSDEKTRESELKGKTISPISTNKILNSNVRIPRKKLPPTKLENYDQNPFNTISTPLFPIVKAPAHLFPTVKAPAPLFPTIKAQAPLFPTVKAQASTSNQNLLAPVNREDSKNSSQVSTNAPTRQRSFRISPEDISISHHDEQTEKVWKNHEEEIERILENHARNEKIFDDMITQNIRDYVAMLDDPNISSEALEVITTLAFEGNLF